jgi:hypothetical protein
MSETYTIFNMYWEEVSAEWRLSRLYWKCWSYRFYVWGHIILNSMNICRFFCRRIWDSRAMLFPDIAAVSANLKLRSLINEVAICSTETWGILFSVFLILVLLVLSNLKGFCFHLTVRIWYLFISHLHMALKWNSCVS